MGWARGGRGQREQGQVLLRCGSCPGTLHKPVSCRQPGDLDLLLGEAEVKGQHNIITGSKTGILVLASGPLGSWLVSGPDRRDLYSKVNRFPSAEERVP